MATSFFAVEKKKFRMMCEKNNQWWWWGRDKEISGSFSDYSSHARQNLAWDAEPCMRLNHLKTCLRFPCLGLNTIIDSISPSFGGKPNPVPFDEKSLTDKSQCKKNSRDYDINIFSPFKTNGRKCDFECPIHGIIYSGKIEGAYFGRVRSIFLTKKVS